MNIRRTNWYDLVYRGREPPAVVARRHNPFGIKHGWAMHNVVHPGPIDRMRPARSEHRPNMTATLCQSMGGPQFVVPWHAGWAGRSWANAHFGIHQNSRFPVWRGPLLQFDGRPPQDGQNAINGVAIAPGASSTPTIWPPVGWDRIAFTPNAFVYIPSGASLAVNQDDLSVFDNLDGRDVIVQGILLGNGSVLVMGDDY